MTKRKPFEFVLTPEEREQHVKVDAAEEPLVTSIKAAFSASNLEDLDACHPHRDDDTDVSYAMRLASHLDTYIDNVHAQFPPTMSRLLFGVIARWNKKLEREHYGHDE